MKHFLVLVFIIILSGQCVAQYANDLTYFKTDRTKTIIQEKAYSTIDTCEAIQVWQYKSVGLILQAKDSISASIYYQTSIDGETWTAATYLDSLSTADSSAAYKEKELAANTLAYAPWVKFHVNINASFRRGTTSATYSFAWIGKRY